jgi:ubiquitin C-terminal hydrolase
MLFGIENIRFDCYRNAVIQTIIRVPPLMKFYGSQYFDSEKSPLSYFIFRLAVAVNINTEKNLRTSILPINKEGNVDFSEFKFVVDKISNNYANSNIQHDAVEFFNEILDVLSNELIELTKEDFIRKTFGLKFESSTKCRECGKLNLLEESDLMLKLNLKFTLYESIKSFEKLENIEKRCDNIDCPSFNQNTIASKQITITSLPDCFIFQFKRTLQNKDNSVSFPKDNFKIGDFFRNYADKRTNAAYSLVSVINYEGEFNDNQQGHYYSFSRDQINGFWWILNDAKKTKIYDVDNISTNKTVVLVYINTALLPEIKEKNKQKIKLVKLVRLSNTQSLRKFLKK